MNNSEFTEDTKDVVLERSDFYKEIRLRGYDYGPEFKLLKKAVVKTDRVESLVQWNDKWEAFTDSVLQMTALKKNKSRDLFLPVRLECLRCDPIAMKTHILSQIDKESTLFPTAFDFYLGNYSFALIEN